MEKINEKKKIRKIGLYNSLILWKLEVFEENRIDELE